MATNRDSLTKGNDALEAIGMPVRMLRYVTKNYTLWQTSGSAHVKHRLNVLSLKAAQYEELAALAPGGSTNEGTTVQTYYHESTHAYVDLMVEAKDADMIALVAHGEAYYRDAPMKDPDLPVATDPYRLFQEAIASYVGHRAATWYGAHESLSTILGMLAESADPGQREDVEVYANMAEFVRERRANYDSRIGQRQFGYQDYAWYSSSQVYTKRRISDRIKAYADAQILDGMIPETFDTAAPLKALYDTALREIARQRAAPAPAVP